jgi:electron transport complex protein RnfB
VGANKLMHTVLSDQCTGCELCVPVCPVDCIAMVPVTAPFTGWQAWSATLAEEARGRYAFHQFRVQREALENDDRLAAKAQAKLADLASHSQHTDPAVLDAKRAVIEAAMQRARAKRASADGAAPAAVSDASPDET